MLSEVPEGWSPSTVRECCDILDGMRVPLNGDQRRNNRGMIPYWGANGIVDYINAHIFDEPLLLMAEDGGYFDEAHSRPICQLVDGKSWVNNHAHVMRVRHGNLREYIYYWFVHRDITPFIKGGTRSKLNQADLCALPILLPPLPEQKKIAAILSSVDEAIQATQAVIDQARRVKEGLLQELLTRGIGHTRFKQTEIGEIPASWEVVQVRDLGEVVAGKARNPDGAGNNRQYLRCANVHDDHIDFDEIFNMPFTDTEFERYALQPGDILLNEGQSLNLVGRPAVYFGEAGRFAFQNSLVRLRANQKVCTPNFAYQLVRFLYQTGALAAVATQTTSIAHLGVSRFASIKIRLPPISEQLRVQVVLLEVDMVQHYYISAITRLRELKSGLLQDLLTGKVRVNP